jgi:hypothetical protein
MNRARPAALKRAQDNYVKRMLSERKMARVSLWIPEENVREIRLIAKDMRDEYRAAQAQEQEQAEAQEQAQAQQN